jgi:IS4 transposase
LRRNRELDNQLEGILRKTNKKTRNIHLHRHTRMHVGMYDCMRSKSESEFGRLLSGILRKANKQKCMLACVC